MALKDGIPAVGEVVANKYRIEGIIGEGGMGAVLSATHQITQRRVALKWMHDDLAKDQEAVQRFIREAQAAGRIDHPNVVVIYDVEKHKNAIFLVMEYLYGEPLTALLARRRLEIAEAIRIVLPALRGVAAAHQHGIVHRDIKPDNIFLCRSPDGRPREAKVLDFGISKFTAKQGTPSLSLTQTGTLIGTPFYMSPEQIRGSKDIGPRTDVYAFGVILYESLSGRRPFEAETLSALVLEIATSTPNRLRELRPEVPGRLEAVVTKAMAREPEDRFPNIASLVRALEPFSGGSSIDSLEPEQDTNRKTTWVAQPASNTSTPFIAESSFPDSNEPRGSKNRLMRFAIGALTLSILIGIIFGVWKLYRNSPERSEPIVQPKTTRPMMTKRFSGSISTRNPSAKSGSDENKRFESASHVENATRENEPTRSKEKTPPSRIQKKREGETRAKDLSKKPTLNRKVRAKEPKNTRFDKRSRTASQIEETPVSILKSDDEVIPQPPSDTSATKPTPGRTGGLELEDF